MTSLELKDLLKKIPELLACCKQFDMTTNVYYEGEQYRVIYDEKNKRFINLETMVAFESDLSPDDMETVSL